MVWGKIPDVQGSSGCGRHQEGFLEEVMGTVEVGQVKKKGRVFPVEGHFLLLPSELSPLDALIEVSQL